MATIHDITAYRKATALRYYATYNDQCGVATRGAGGYTFRPDTTPGTRLVSPADPALVLSGSATWQTPLVQPTKLPAGRRPRLPLEPGAVEAPQLPSHPTDRRTTMSSFTAHPMLTPHDDTMIAWQQACAPAADTSARSTTASGSQSPGAGARGRRHPGCRGCSPGHQPWHALPH